MGATSTVVNGNYVHRTGQVGEVAPVGWAERSMSGMYANLDPSQLCHIPDIPGLCLWFSRYAHAQGTINCSSPCYARGTDLFVVHITPNLCVNMPFRLISGAARRWRLTITPLGSSVWSSRGSKVDFHRNTRYCHRRARLKSLKRLHSK